ncbi:MAG: hypothetical protein WBB31_16945 [Saprospiraceae bacterium]
MSRYFILLFLFSIMLIHVSCGVDCSKVNCASPGGTLTFKVTKDGKNALFGTDSISHDSIRLFVTITDTSSYDIPIQYDPISGDMRLNMDQDVTYILKIDSLRNDTFQVFAVPAGMDDCCKLYQLNSATKNGQNLCGNGCNETFEIQL